MNSIVCVLSVSIYVWLSMYSLCCICVFARVWIHFTYLSYCLRYDSYITCIPYVAYYIYIQFIAASWYIADMDSFNQSLYPFILLCLFAILQLSFGYVWSYIFSSSKQVIPVLSGLGQYYWWSMCIYIFVCCLSICMLTCMWHTG